MELSGHAKKSFRPKKEDGLATKWQCRINVMHSLWRSSLSLATAVNLSSLICCKLCGLCHRSSGLGNQTIEYWCLNPSTERRIHHVTVYHRYTGKFEKKNVLKFLIN